MKKIYVFLFLISISNINLLFAQKCKPKYTLQDEFTGISTKYWGGNLSTFELVEDNLGFTFYPKIFIIKDNGKNMLLMNIEVARGKKVDFSNKTINPHIWFEKGTKILLKLDHKIISLELDKAIIHLDTKNQDFLLLYEINDDVLNDLITNSVSQIKIYPFKNSEEITFWFKVSKKRWEKIQSQFKCFVSEK